MNQLSVSKIAEEMTKPWDPEGPGSRGRVNPQVGPSASITPEDSFTLLAHLSGFLWVSRILGNTVQKPWTRKVVKDSSSSFASNNYRLFLSTWSVKRHQSGVEWDWTKSWLQLHYTPEAGSLWWEGGHLSTHQLWTVHLSITGKVFLF